MSTTTDRRIAGFGDCTQRDLDELDGAIAAMRKAEQDREDTRRTAGHIMGKLIDKGAQRKAMGDRLGLDAQTVTYMVNGRPSRSEMRNRSKVK